MEGVGEEGVLDVGGDELLVLLLVLEAEDDAAGGLVLYGLLQEAGHGCVDVGAVGEDGVEGRAGEGGPELLLGHVAERVVVAVEEPAELGMEGLVGGDELAEDEGLEEPAGVGEVPFDGAGLGTGLDHEVLWRERTTEVGGGLADGLITDEEWMGGDFDGGGHGGFLSLQHCSSYGMGWGWVLLLFSQRGGLWR